MKNYSEGFKKELNLFDSTMIVIGVMIGSGIFIVSSDIARTVGSGGLLLLVWLITGVVTLIGALSYGELAAMMPQAGGQYVYLRESYNPLVGFLYGWTLFLVIQSGSIAAVGVAFSKFTAVLIPWFGESNILFSISGLDISSNQLLAIASIIFLTYLNAWGIKEGKMIQNLFTVAKILSLAGLVILGIFLGANTDAISSNFSSLWNGEWLQTDGGIITSIEPLSGIVLIAAISSAMVGSLFASDAWNNITFTAGEIKNPKRNIPLSLFYGSLIVTVLYILVNVTYLLVLPLKGNINGTDVTSLGLQFAESDRAATATVQVFLGESAAVIMAVLIMVSTFGCNNGMILAGARVYYAMAKDKLFFASTGKLNKNSVPGKALAFQAAWSCILCLSGTYGNLLDYVIFAVLIFYILTIAGIFVLRKRKPDAERPYKAFGYPYLPLLYIILATTISVMLLLYKPQYTWPGLIIVLLGIPVYYIWQRKNKTEDEKNS